MLSPNAFIFEISQSPLLQLIMHSDRAGADVVQLLRRFENIIAFTPVRIALVMIFMIVVFECALVNIWFGLGWACLGGGVLGAVVWG